MTVNGAPGNDIVQLVAGKLPNTWVLTVNGKSQTIGAGVTTLNVNGEGGFNQLSIVGTGKSETAELWSDHAIFLSGDLTFTATNFVNSVVNGVLGGSDSVLYHDTAGNGWFVGMPYASSLSSTTFFTKAMNFAYTNVVSVPGKSSVANFYPSTAATTTNTSASSLVVQLAGPGIDCESAFFSKVQIYNQAGSVARTILPTSSVSKTVALPIAYLKFSTTEGPNQKNLGAMPTAALVDAVLASRGS